MDKRSRVGEGEVSSASERSQQGPGRKRQRQEDSERDGHVSDEEVTFAPRSVPEEVMPSSSNSLADGFGEDENVAKPQMASQASLPSDTSKDALVLQPETGASKRRKLDRVAIHGPAYPVSFYQGHEPPAAASRERHAVCALKAKYDQVHALIEKPEFTFFRLSDFSVYRPLKSATKDRHGGELITVDKLLLSNTGCDSLLVDGVLSYDGERHYIRGAKFSILTIDGYGDANAFNVNVCIQTPVGAATDVWYQLAEPSFEYRRFYTPFLWLAQFSKAFVEYLLETESVDLRHFGRNAQFPSWLQARYGGNPDFHAWLDMAGLKEFRTTVAANVGFLIKEAYSIDKRLARLPLWGEVDPIHLTAIPAVPNRETRTVVTPFAYDLFRRMYFGAQLKTVSISDASLRKLMRSRKEELKLTPLDGTEENELAMRVPLWPLPRPDVGPIQVRRGDVVAVAADNSGIWKNSAQYWYAYVQEVRPTHKGNVRLDVLWMYSPQDTTLGAAYYPYQNELFLSDNCGCGTEAVSLEDVVFKVEVEWHVVNPLTAKGLFVRQAFSTVAEEDRYSFETLKQEADFRCHCKTPINEWAECILKYRIHDTVLVHRIRPIAAGGLRLGGKTYPSSVEIDIEVSDENLAKLDSLGEIDRSIEPAEIVGFDESTQTARLRPFSRTGRAQNELMPGNTTIWLPASRIVRKCHVRVFSGDEIQQKLVPTPYDCGGTGDCYYVARTSSPVSFTQGFGPLSPIRKLRGMGIFCGGGNLDRGLEDSSEVEFDYAVDWATHALHSYRAASRNPRTQYFLGSVDDYLAAALIGLQDKRVAVIGALDLLAAGSPCPGFSALNNNKLSEGSLKNASMVASVVSFVDFYSPKYFVLENVVTMTQGMGIGKNENVFSQMLAGLVALGYQVQQFLMDAWSYGSCQQRSRVFIVASAPDMTPLSAPPHTHAHPNYIEFRDRNLGRSSNNLPFGKRRNVPTPFPHVSASKACSDLIDIGDAQVRLCPAFPDHRTPTNEGGLSRSRIAMVPVRPGGVGIVQAVQAGAITGGEPFEYVGTLGHLQAAEGSTTYARVHPDKLVATLTTALRIRDGVAGRTLHWREPRSITVMECKRTQGYKDDDVLVGTPHQQMMIIGNSVDRKVSLALGMALRESRTKKSQPPTSPTVVIRASRTAVRRTSTDDSSAAESTASGSSSKFSMPELASSVPTTPPQRDSQGAVTLSDDQVQDVRANGFKAILRILGSSPRNASSAT